ncbi:MAG: helix-turn-helix transcriptional regulator [Eubacterium sp.]|nr:helix-turn-helix transcriptional regulator [Eubacterium sp.]
MRDAKEAAGYTQERLAEAIDVSIQYISDLERGLVGASLSTLMSLCTTLHTSSDHLLFGPGEGTDLSNINFRLSSLNPEELKFMERGIDLYLIALRYNEMTKE